MIPGQFRHRLNSLWKMGLVLFAWGWLAACSGQASSGRALDSFIPPTASNGAGSPLLAPATLTPTSLPRVVRPIPTPSCTNILSFLDDVTIPDGMAFQPGATIDKRWKVENNGTCNWDERYRLKLASESSLGANPEQALYPARSGAQVDLRIIFTAPPDPGTYRSLWQAHDPDGLPFGDQFYIEFVVEAPAP